MKFDPLSMIGTWYAELCSDASNDGFFRVFDDFRFVSFTEDDRPETRRRWTPMRLWVTFDEDGACRLRPRKDAAVWTREISFDGDIMVVESKEPEHLVWRCRKLNGADIPEWFEPEVALALQRPWK